MQESLSHGQSQQDLLTQILKRLEAAETSNKSLSEEVSHLKTTIEELKHNPSTANGRPPNRVPTTTGVTNKNIKQPVTIETIKSLPRTEKVISANPGTRTKLEETKKQEPQQQKKDEKKDDKKEDKGKKQPKVNPVVRPTEQKKIVDQHQNPHKATVKPETSSRKDLKEPVKTEKDKEHSKQDKQKVQAKIETKPNESKTVHQSSTTLPSITPVVPKKDVKRPALDKNVTSSVAIQSKEKQPKVISSGGKKDDKKPNTATKGQEKSGITKQIGQKSKLAAEENDKHVEIERLELSELAQTTGQEAATHNYTVDSKTQHAPSHPHSKLPKPSQQQVKASDLAADIGDLLN